MKALNDMKKIHVKRQIFELLTTKFETQQFKDYFLDMIDHIPDYILTMPSSTSGRYHNEQQCQPHGQLYHIFMFQSIIESLISLKHNKELYNSPMERDAMRCVPAFHDAIKCGWNGSQYTVQDHPKLAKEWVLNTKTEHDIPPLYKDMIANMCEAHSGEWNKNRSGQVIMSEPRNEREFLIHECDILASRKDLSWEISDELKAVLDEIPEPTPEDYVLTFGKHKGETLGEVKALYPDYIDWMRENIDREPLKSLLEKV